MQPDNNTDPDLIGVTTTKRIKMSVNVNVLGLLEDSQSTSYVCNNVGTETTSKENKESDETLNIIKKKESKGMEEMLLCNICCDIMYNCLSIRPCLHTYCGVCLIDWMNSGDVCPMCRGSIEGVSKNHLLTNIINKYLEDHPDKVKTQNERDEADKKVLKEMYKLNKVKVSTSDPDSTIQLSVNGCPYCHYPNPIHSDTPTIDLTDAPLSNFACTSTTVHTMCQCCSIYIPILPVTEHFPRVRCQICNTVSCSLLLGSCNHCLHGCLHIFKDFVLNPDLNSVNQVPQFLPENFFETNILRNYLNSQHITVVDMFKDCLDRLFRGDISLGQSIDSSTALCLICSQQMVLDMVYEYFRQIPKSYLPASVTARPDCYYGRNCRTQRTRQHHAVNYNHACPQTRF